MGLIDKVSRVLLHATEPVRKFHPMDRGYVQKSREMTETIDQNANVLALPPLDFPARAILPQKTIRSSYTIRTPNSSATDAEFETIIEQHDIRFPPMTLDTQQKTEVYLKNLSASVPQGSLFPDSIVQPDGINFENLNRYNQAYAALLRNSSRARTGPLKNEIDNIADGLLSLPETMNKEAMKRYKTYDDYHGDNVQARYMSQAQAELLAADQMRQLSEYANEVANRNGIDQETRTAFNALSEHFNAIKRSFVSHASQGLMKDDSEYKKAQDGLYPEIHKSKLTPGADSQSRTTGGIKVGFKGGLSKVFNYQASALLGITSFGQKSTGRDLETSVTRTTGPSISLDGQITTGADFLTSRTFANGIWSSTGGKQFKAEDTDGRNKGEFELDKKNRKNYFFNGAGPEVRSRHAGWNRFTNSLGKVLAGSPGKSPDQPFFVTQDKVGKGKFNQQEIIDGAAVLDKHFGSDEEVDETFRNLSMTYHPALEQRFEKIDEVGQTRDVKASDIEAHAPGAYYPTAISGMPANRYNNSKHVNAPMRQTDLIGTIGHQIRASGFDAKQIPGSVAPSPVAPSLDLSLGLSKRAASNTQQRHKSLVEMAAPGKLLLGDIYSILEETKRTYDEHNPRGSNGHPLRQARDAYTVKTLGLPNDQSLQQWKPSAAEQGFYGNPKDIPIDTRRTIAAMRAKDSEGNFKVDALLPLSETTKHLRGIESELKSFYVDATTVNSHFDSPEGRRQLEVMSQRYTGGGYRFPKKLSREDMNSFFNSVHNDFMGSVIEVAANNTAFNYEGVKQLQTASKEKKDDFRAAVEKSRQAYSRAAKLLQQDYLPDSIISQRENDIVAVGVSDKNEYRTRLTASAHLGATNDTGIVDEVLKTNMNGPRHNVFAEIRKINQLENINPLRLGTMHVVTLTGSEGGNVHTGLKSLTKKFKDVEHRQVMEDVKNSTPLNMLFGRNGSGFEYQVWTPDTSTLNGANKVAREVSRKTVVDLQASSIDIVPLEGVVKWATGLPLVVAPATRYSREEKIPIESKIGGVPSEIILAMNKATPNFGDKATGKMHSFEKINKNLKSEEAETHLKSFFSELNAIPKVVHLFQVAALNKPDDPFNDFHNLLYGYGESGERLRRNTAATAHYSPTSKSDPFDAPPFDRDLYQDLIDDAKSNDWPLYNAELVSRLEKMGPHEQLDFYTQNPEGQKILQKFWDVASKANAHVSVMKGAKGIGYTMTPHKQLIRQLPVKNEEDPSATEPSIFQRVGRSVGNVFTGHAGFKSVPMPDTVVHGNRQQPTFSTQMTFPRALEIVREEPFAEPPGADDLERPSSASGKDPIPSTATSLGGLKNTSPLRPEPDAINISNAAQMASSSFNSSTRAVLPVMASSQVQSDRLTQHVDILLPDPAVPVTSIEHEANAAVRDLQHLANSPATSMESATLPLAVHPEASGTSDTQPVLPVSVQPPHDQNSVITQDVVTNLHAIGNQSSSEGITGNAPLNAPDQQLRPFGQSMVDSTSPTHWSSASSTANDQAILPSSVQSNEPSTTVFQTPSIPTSGTSNVVTPFSGSVQNNSIDQMHDQQTPTSSLGGLVGSGMPPTFDPENYSPLSKPPQSVMNIPMAGASSLVTHF